MVAPCITLVPNYCPYMYIDLCPFLKRSINAPIFVALQERVFSLESALFERVHCMHCTSVLNVFPDRAVPTGVEQSRVCVLL